MTHWQPSDVRAAGGLQKKLVQNLFRVPLPKEEIQEFNICTSAIFVASYKILLCNYEESVCIVW